MGTNAKGAEAIGVAYACTGLEGSRSPFPARLWRLLMRELVRVLRCSQRGRFPLDTLSAVLVANAVEDEGLPSISCHFARCKTRCDVHMRPARDSNRIPSKTVAVVIHARTCTGFTRGRR